MMDEEGILEEVAGFLHGYLKSGTVNMDSFISKINPNISNLEQLLTIRFLLKKETKQFVQALSGLLKRFKTTTWMKNEVSNGEIRGEIAWDETIKERLAGNYGDPTIYATNESIRTYETPENLVLKELLRVLYDALFTDEFIKGFEEATWFKEWQQLKGNVARAYKRNIYLQRVARGHVSTRMIVKTKAHRNRLYREAALLLFDYRKIIHGNYSEDDLRSLLQSTFIAPDNKNVLFELYWVVQLIKQNTENSQLHLMGPSQNMVASWGDERYTYKLYHDSIGSGALRFGIESSEIKTSENPVVQRKYMSFTASRFLAESLFGKKRSTLIWNGRPDFLVEMYEKDTSKLARIIVGEVKNTRNRNYVMTGLEELLDYIHFAKDQGGNYIQGGNIQIQGILCTGNVSFNDGIATDSVKMVTREKDNGLRIVT